MEIEKVAAKRSKTHTRYYDKAGELLPGVTTALGILSKGALVPWANKLGLAGIEVSKYVDALAEIGTIAHAMILAHHKNEPFQTKNYPADLIDKAENCLISYFEWEKGHSVEPVLCEQAFISERLKYGGTIDLVAKIDGVLTLADYKSSKALYDEHVFQVAAYHQLLLENEINITAVRVLRVGREETEGFTDRPISPHELKVGTEIFNHCLSIYRMKKKFKL